MQISTSVEQGSLADGQSTWAAGYDERHWQVAFPFWAWAYHDTA